MNTVKENAAVITVNHQFDVKAEPVPLSPTPVLITENEVILSTAAAAPVRPATISWWTKATRGVGAAMQQMFLTSGPDGRLPRRDYPKRYAFLEYSCMSREMDRL